MFQHPDPRWADHGWWWPWFGGVIPLLMFAVLVGLAVWAVLRLSSHPRTAAGLGAALPAPPRDPVLDEVRLAYARGQISREEFLQRSLDLGGVIPDSAPSPPAPAPPAEPTRGGSG